MKLPSALRFRAHPMMARSHVTCPVQDIDLGCGGGNPTGLDDKLPNFKGGEAVNNTRDRFLELLEADAAMLREAAEAWEELGKHGARLEDLNGRPVATAAEMVERYRRQEKELRNLIGQRGSIR